MDFKLNFIVCADNQGGIAKDGDIPWSFAADMKHFKETTRGGIVIMGRRTWESIDRELPDRHTIAMTRGVVRDGRVPPETSIGGLVSGKYVRCTAQSTREALEICRLILIYHPGISVWVAGGQEIYEAFIKECPDRFGILKLTTVDDDFGCDRTFPFSMVDLEPLLTTGICIGEYQSLHIDRKTNQPHILKFSTRNMKAKK